MSGRSCGSGDGRGAGRGAGREIGRELGAGRAIGGDPGRTTGRAAGFPDGDGTCPGMVDGRTDGTRFGVKIGDGVRGRTGVGVLRRSSRRLLGSGVRRSGRVRVAGRPLRGSGRPPGIRRGRARTTAPSGPRMRPRIRSRAILPSVRNTDRVSRLRRSRIVGRGALTTTSGRTTSGGAGGKREPSPAAGGVSAGGRQPLYSPGAQVGGDSRSTNGGCIRGGPSGDQIAPAPGEIGVRGPSGNGRQLSVGRGTSLAIYSL